jgi:steroid 5-alpha reductase family enzyme
MKKLVALVTIFPLTALLSLRFGAVLAGFPTIATFFHGAHPVLVVATLAGGFVVASYLLSAVTGDYSWVDRLWSTAPVAFAWIYAVRAGFSFAPTVAALLVTLWGARLTYNFARRGGYTTMEDYRWPILRERIDHPVLWQLFSLLFISCFQVSLFVLFTLPVYRLATIALPVPVPIVGAFAIAFLLFLAYETIADQQQWTFQNMKHGFVSSDDPPAWLGAEADEARVNLEADIRRGFLTHGLFGLSRHPNYFGELMVWWTLYLLAAAAGGSLVDASALGALLLTVLFVGSTVFTESISASRYPEYREYQRRTSAIVPWIPGSLRPDESAAPGA